MTFVLPQVCRRLWVHRNIQWTLQLTHPAHTVDSRNFHCSAADSRSPRSYTAQHWWFLSWTVHLVFSHATDKSKHPLGKMRYYVGSVLVIHVDTGQIWPAVRWWCTHTPFVCTTFNRVARVLIGTTGFHQLLALLISCKIAYNSATYGSWWRISIVYSFGRE
jgi:hypothetical protein